MIKIQNDNLSNNNLEFLNSLSADEYPTAVLFKEHFKKHSPLQTLDEILHLESFVHNYKTKQDIVNSVCTLWIYRSAILQLLKFEDSTEAKEDLEHLEESLSMLKDEALENALRTKRVIKEAVQDGCDISEFGASINLMKLCIKLSESNIQAMTKSSN